MASFGSKRIGGNIVLTGGSGGSSASGDLALDRMVSDVLIHASKSGLKLLWEDGPLASVFGESTMQHFPVVEQCISSADHPDVKSVGTRATMQLTEVVVSKRTCFDHAVSVKIGRTKTLKYLSQVELMNRRFEALLSTAFDASRVGVKTTDME